MGEIVNLRQVKRRTAREAAREAAASNRLQHGRAKAERAATDRQREQDVRLLDARKLEPED